MPTNAYSLIEPNQTLAERPFTDAAHAAEDVRWLRGMAQCLRHTLTSLPADLDAELAPFAMRHHEPDGRWCRVVVCNASVLKSGQDLAAVGFFGQKREASASVAQQIHRLDDELLTEFLQHPFIVGYCTQQLRDDNYGNFVLMSHLEAKKQWEASERHRYAAFELAPKYYATVRIHNLELPGGVNAPELILRRTKYYDYAQPTVWRGVREQAQPVAFAFS